MKKTRLGRIKGILGIFLLLSLLAGAILAGIGCAAGGSTPPDLTTNTASAVDTTSATLNGFLTSLGDASSVGVSFQWGLSTSYTYETTLQGVTSTGTFNASLSSLSPSLTYHFRAKAVGNGTSYGSDLTFTTLSTPVVNTNPATSVTTTTATLNGNLTSLGTEPSVNVSLQWGLSNSYGSETPTGNMTATGPFQANITGLTQGTTYHFRAKAVGNGTSYGSDITFTTIYPLPAVITNAASAVTTTTASLNGNLTSLGTASTVTVYFQWGLTASYGAETPAQTVNATAPFQGDIPGLSPCTPYHFRAKAAGTGTVYGSDMIFTTLCPPRVSTSPATNLTRTSAVLNLWLTGLGTASTVTVSFQWGLTASYGSETPPVNMNATGVFRGNITGLTQAMRYHFRAKAVGTSTVYGSDMIFDTPGVPPNADIADTRINSRYQSAVGDRDTNYGTDTSIFVEAYDPGGISRILVKFDLSGIPAGSTINSATFSAYYYNHDARVLVPVVYTGTQDPVGSTYYVYRNTDTWTEGGVTWNNKPSYTTSQGAEVTMPADYGWVSWNVKDIVQTWVNGTANYGFVMMDSKEANPPHERVAFFYSREYADPTLRPKLVIDYTAP